MYRFSKYIILTLFFFISFCVNLTAQEKKNILQGIVVGSEKKGKPISDVIISNLSSKETFMNENDGSFKVSIKDGDTLRFKKLGYHTQFYFFKKIFEAENYSVQIVLTSDTLSLKPFVYKSLSREKEIQNDFMNAFIRDSLRMVDYLKKLQMEASKSFTQKAIESFNSPVTFIYDQFGRKARQRNKIERYRQILLEEKEKREPDYAK